MKSTSNATLAALIFLAPALALVVTAAGFMIGASAQLIVIMAIGTPLLLLQDQVRFTAMALLRPRVALLSDSVWLFVVLLGIAAGPILDFPPATWWLAGLAAALTVGWVPIHPVPGAMGATLLLRNPSKIGGSKVVGVFMAQGSALTLAAVVSALVGLDAVGAIQSAATLMAPANAMMAFVVLSYTPTLFRSSRTDQRKVAARLALLLSLAPIVTAVGVSLLPATYGQTLLGDTWGAARQVVHWTAVGYVALGVTTASVVVLTVRDQSGAIILIQALAALLTLTLGFLAAVMFGSASSVVAVTSLGAYLPLLLSWSLLLIGQRDGLD